MSSYEFIFSDGTHMQGDGEDLADALHNAYLRNGYLPISRLVEKKEFVPVETNSRPPDVPSPKGCDTASHGRLSRRTEKRGPVLPPRPPQSIDPGVKF